MNLRERDFLGSPSPFFLYRLDFSVQSAIIGMTSMGRLPKEKLGYTQNKLSKVQKEIAMESYTIGLLANYDRIHGILEAQLKNHPETDVEITSSTLKFFFPIDGMPKGMVAHAPEDDVRDEVWIKDLRDFVRNTCQLNGLMTNAKDLGNIRYTLPVRVVLEKLDIFKGK